MASKPQNSQKTVYIEYCRSCDTHNWCTHHDEAKYHHTFLKLSELIAESFPNIEVIGNMVPSHLIPFKISENKYIDSQTNKYVVYPQIGSFQVRFNNVTVYSKKDNNAWPNLPSIVSKIGSIIDPNYKSPPKIEKSLNSPKKEQENTLQKKEENSRFMKSEDEKVKVYKDQSKGFTLTDHFKLYRPKTKHEDKDWLTEKPQSEGSLKQFSQQFRGQSRQKSEKSQDSKNRRDFNGQTKLKQMLRSKGLMLKQQGKKEMIIKLDSIEEENANYQEGNGATQRTQEIPSKKNKMQELEDEFSSLQNRFKNFENKVHDIHNKNRQFQYKQQPTTNQYSKFKNSQVKNDEPTRKQSKKQQAAQKQNFYFNERASKLNQYLNASEEEKNQKLHKIYGQWKYLKQTAQKNKKLLKNKRRNSQEPLSSDQQSQTHSNSPSYIANIITFKPKKDKSTPKLGSYNNKEKGHKYSTLQKYESKKVLVSEPKFRTGEHFYNRNMKNQQFINTQSQQQVKTSSKLLKKGLGTMSMQTLKKYASKEALINHQRPQRGEEISQFSESAQKNIKQIQSRITNIQNQLQAQKQSQETSYFGKSTLQAIKDVYSNNKSRSHSHASNYSTKNQKKRQTQNKAKNHQNGYHNSHRHPNNKNFRNVAKTKAENKEKSRISQATSNEYRKQGANHSQAIQQQSELIENNNQSYSELRQEKDNNGLKQSTFVNKKDLNKNYHLQRKQRGNRESTNNLRSSAFPKNQEKLLKSQFKKDFNVTQPKKIKINNYSNHNEQRISKVETDFTHNNELSYDNIQKESRKHEYPLHQQVTYLRKKKEWRESQPVKKSKKERQLRSSEEQQISRSYEQQDSLVEQSQDKNKLSQSKQTVFKIKNHMKSTQRQNSDTPKKPISKQNDQRQFTQLKQKSQFGRIRKNKSRQQDAMRYTEKQAQGQERYEQNNGQLREESEEQVQNGGQQRQHYEVEAQEVQNEDDLAYNQNVESDPSVIHSSQTQGSRNSDQQSKPVQKIVSKSQKTQQMKMKKVNTKPNLSYYKSSEICYEGQKKHQTSHNNQSQLESDNPKVDEVQRKNSLHQQLSGQSIQNGVSGWKLNSQEEGESDQIIGDREQGSDKMQEEAELQSLENPKLRNSLDQQLENNSDRHLTVEQKEEQQQQENSQRDRQQRRTVIMRSQTKLNQQKLQQPPSEQKQEAAQNFEQGSVAKQIKQKISPTANEKTVEKVSQVELQNLITKQYTGYLISKLADVISQQTIKEIPTNMQNKQAKEYLDCGIAINLITCPSVASINSHKSIPSIPASFMDYRQPEELKYETIDHKQDECQEQQSREQIVEMQKQNVLLNKTDSQSKQVQEYVNGVNQTVVANFCTPQGSSITQIVAIQKKQQTSTQAENKTPQNYNETVKQQQHTSMPQAALVQINDFKEATLPAIAASAAQQKNNVYSQAKQVSKFRQIGIQKELTLEVSVQTDHPPQDLTADIFMVRASSAKSNVVYSPPTSQQSHKRKVEMVESIFEQNNPVKNNYFSESKKESLFQKKKPLKQIQRAHIIDKIYSPTLDSQMQKYTNLVAGAEQDIQKEQGPVIKLVDFYLQGEIFSAKGIEPQLVETKFTRLLKVVQILCEKSDWLITRLFQDRGGVLKDKAFGLWLCRHYQWQCFIVDDAVLVNQQNHPFYSVHAGNQLWFNILQKAVALALGGYQNLVKAQTPQLFTMLTGCNSIVSKIKQEPSKNSKLLSLISQCLRKNYVIHAEKSDKSKKEQTKENIYYIHSIRKAGPDQQTLIQLSQNDRESFWVKLSKFVTEFSKIEILQLRINHNFTHLDLGVGRPGQLTVVQLQFQQDAQGCVTLCYLGQSGALRAFLYKQQKHKVLKLIGQAKQKNKSHLFFQCSFTQGKYFIFAQAEQRPARIAFLGQSHPRLTITEQIHSQGLKNDMAEYLPVRQNEQARMKRSEMDSQLQWRGKIPRLQDNFVQSRLRQTFIEYMVGRNKR